MSSGNVDVDIGVIYSGERHWLYPLLETLSQSGDGVTMRLILIDNCADDEFRSVDKLFDRHLVLHNQRQQGYAANLNRVLAASTAPYVLALNTDMNFAPQEQCVARMVDFMDQHPRCGLAGCRILHADGHYAHSARRFPTPRIILARRLPFVQAFPSALKQYFYAERDERDTFQCDWVSGCFMMIRRSASREVGLFDEKYPRYFEDIDYCQRVYKKGWNVMYYGGTYCYHYEQRSSKRLFSTAAAAHVYSYCRWLAKQRGTIVQRQDSTEGYFPVEERERKTA